MQIDKLLYLVEKNNLQEELDQRVIDELEYWGEILNRETDARRIEFLLKFLTPQELEEDLLAALEERNER